MLTQREKIEILTEQIKHHDFFEGPFMISRREAEVVLKAMAVQYRELKRNHERYLAEREKINQREKERYQAKKQEIKAQRKRRAFEKAMEAIK